MADICKKLAPRLGLNADEMYTIGLMHDIGKMYIPDAILKKDGALSVLEREIIDLHSYYGYVILKIMEYRQIYMCQFYITMDLVKLN